MASERYTGTFHSAEGDETLRSQCGEECLEASSDDNRSPGLHCWREGLTLEASPDLTMK